MSHHHSLELTVIGISIQFKCYDYLFLVKVWRVEFEDDKMHLRLMPVCLSYVKHNAFDGTTAVCTNKRL